VSTPPQGGNTTPSPQQSVYHRNRKKTMKRMQRDDCASAEQVLWWYTHSHDCGVVRRKGERKERSCKYLQDVVVGHVIFATQQPFPFGLGWTGGDLDTVCGSGNGGAAWRMDAAWGLGAALGMGGVGNDPRDLSDEHERGGILKLRRTFGPVFKVLEEWV